MERRWHRAINIALMLALVVGLGVALLPQPAPAQAVNTFTEAGKIKLISSIEFERASGSTGTSHSIDIGAAGNNRLVVVVAGFEGATSNLTAVTVDGKNATKLYAAHNPDGAQNHLEMWYILESTLGSSSGTVTASITGGTSAWATHVMVFYGVKQTAPYDYEVEEAQTTGPTVDVENVSSLDNSIVIFASGQGQGALTPSWTSPLTTRTDGPDPSSADLATASGIETTGQTNKTYTCTWSSTYNRATAIVAVWEEATVGWYDANWQYRRAVTIDHTKVEDVADPSTTYADFPVLVYATGLSNIKANGADIRFTSSDGTTELPREIESYSGGTLYAWAKVTLTKDSSDSSDDVIYMYYGNDSASEPAPDSTYGSENVWDTNFKAVYHLSEDPTATPTDWGKTAIGTSSTTASHSRAMGGTSPNVDDMKIKSISIYLGAQIGDVRLAVYTGGDLDDPTNATLLWDAGTVNPGGTAGWYTIEHPGGGVDLPENTVTWLAWKRNTGVAVYYDTTVYGDFQTARGRNNNSFNQDPTVAFPSTYGEIGTFTNYWYSIYATYQVATIKDSTSNANHGTPGGGMTSVDQVSGQVNGSLDFDGSNDYITFPTNFTAGQSEVTVEMWIYLDEWVADNTIYDGYSGLYWQFSLLEGNWYTRDTSTGPTGSRDNDLTWTSPGTGAWHHLALRYSVSGSIKAIYVDGSPSASTSTSIDTLTSDRDDERLGYPSDGSYYDGRIDELRISTGIARSAEWIKTCYNNQSSPSTFYDVGHEEEKPSPSSQRWYLSSTAGSWVMYKGDDTKTAGTVTVADDGSEIWVANEAATVDVGFPANTWTGVITLDDASTSNETFAVEVGRYVDTTFTSYGSQTFSEYGDDKTHSFSISAGGFTVPETKYLALRITNPAGSGNLVVKTGLNYSYLTSGASDPGYPVPELPTIILLGAGLACLGGYIIFMRRKRRSVSP